MRAVSDEQRANRLGFPVELRRNQPLLKAVDCPQLEARCS